jgi:hypothetical protein
VKTGLTIAFLALYVILTTGFQVLVHTCGGETTATATAGKADDPCGCGDMPEQDRCCTTQVVTVHLDDDQQIVVIALPGPDFSAAQVLPFTLDAPGYPLAAPAIHVIDTSPPSYPSPHLLNCTFLI